MKVEGYKQADGSILAKEIKASGPKDGEHEKEGVKVEGELTAHERQRLDRRRHDCDGRRQDPNQGRFAGWRYG